MNARFSLLWGKGTADRWEPLVVQLFVKPEVQHEDPWLRGAAEIYERAHAWGHLPMQMEFATFLAAIERGDDPFVEAEVWVDEEAYDGKS